MQFNELPRELQYHVFSFLSQEELMKYVAPVCRNWYEMAYDPLFWTSLNFIGFKHSVELVARILKLSVYVTNLNISHFDDEFDWFSFLPKRETLRELCLTHCRDINDKNIFIFVDKFPFVEKITFNSAHAFNENLVHQINRWKMIKKLDICLWHLANPNWEECINFIAENFHQMNDFALDCFNLSERSFLTLGKMKGKQLTKLSLHSLRASDTVLRILGESFCKLTELCLSACRLTENFLTAIERIENLQILNLNLCTWDHTKANFCSNEYVRSFKEAKFYNLVELNYYCCPLSDDAIKFFPQCFPSLQKLHLNSNRSVTEKGLSAAMSGFRNLNYLYINDLPRVTGRCFLHFPPNCFTLKIRNCPKITDAIVEEISQKRPNVKIIQHTKKPPVFNFVVIPSAYLDDYLLALEHELIMIN